ncbi:unnamed protein product [Spirodela intermedia]|uniref:Uncharacterized protein n=1 Tax=Spirodela intermedia TaxID=51605 RepID=A0A7I8KVE6_SPIIN|nr:unnamed protein product [Spirodela intermedia]
MGPFPSAEKYEYILLAVDYVSKWVEAIPTRTNDHKIVMKFLRNEAYENHRIYKEKTKTFHDKYISRKKFDVRQKIHATRLPLLKSYCWVVPWIFYGLTRADFSEICFLILDEI